MVATPELVRLYSLASRYRLTIKQMKKNLFDTRNAETLILRFSPEGSSGKGEAVALALVRVSQSQLVWKGH